MEDNTFAAACYNENSTDELIDALMENAADDTDCENWKITPTQWRKDIAEALREKVNDLKNK